MNLGFSVILEQLVIDIVVDLVKMLVVKQTEIRMKILIVIQYYKPFNDTAKIPGGTANHQAVLGYSATATHQSFLTLDISDTELWDAKLRTADGTQLNELVLDAGANRILLNNFTNEGYYITLEGRGSADNNIKLTITICSYLCWLRANNIIRTIPI